jgi:Tfp pilus assembly protein PilZ
MLTLPLTGQKDRAVLMMGALSAVKAGTLFLATADTITLNMLAVVEQLLVLPMDMAVEGAAAKVAPEKTVQTEQSSYIGLNKGV